MFISRVYITCTAILLLVVGNVVQSSDNSTSSTNTTSASSGVKNESTTDSSTSLDTPIHQVPTSATPLTAATQSSEIPRLKNDIAAVDFSIKYLNENYTVELINQTSGVYVRTREKYYNKTYQYYQEVQGFVDITSIIFRKGSLIVDFSASFQYFKNYTDGNYLNLELVKKTLERIRNDSDVDFDYTLPLFLQSIQGLDVCHLYQCKPGYVCYQVKGNARCKTELLCDEKCHDGECVFNKDVTPVCRCRETDNVVYTGSQCQETVEKFALKKDYIIAIAAGGGGGVVLIFCIIIMAMCFKINNNNNNSMQVKESIDEKDNRSEQSFQSMKDSEDGLRQPYTINTAMSDPTFRRTDRNVSDFPKPFTVQASSGLPLVKTSSATALAGNVINDYQYSRIRSPVDNGDMRRQSRVRVIDDVENSPDYDRRESQVRGSIDATNIRKNSNFSLLPQRRRSSALADVRTSNVTRNPLYSMPQSRRKSSVYSEIEDNYSKSMMYQPGNNGELPVRQTGNPRLYDYYRRNDSVTSPGARPTALSDIYDYDEDNSRMYGLRKSQQNPMPRKY